MTKSGDVLQISREPKPLPQKTNLPEAISALPTAKPGETKKPPTVLEIPRNLTVAELQALPGLNHEIGFGIRESGIYVIGGESNSIARLDNILPDHEPTIINLHSHPMLLGKPDPSSGEIITHETKAISPGDAVVVGLDNDDPVRGIITAYGLLIYGRATKIPEGMPNPDNLEVNINELDSERGLMFMYANARGINMFASKQLFGGEWPKEYAGTVGFYDMPLSQQDAFMLDFMRDSGMLIAEIPWSDSAKLEQSLHIMNTATTRTTARNQFAALV